METTICCKGLAWTPILQIVVLCLGTFTSYMVAYSNGSVSIYLPFLSETGADVPQICIFSYTLILGSFIGVIVVTYRFLVLKHALSKGRHNTLLKLNKASLCCGLISMASLAGVAAIPMSTVYLAHLAAAGLHFFTAFIFLFLQTYISYYSPEMYSKWSKLRILIFLCFVGILVALIILFPVSHKLWRKDNTKRPSLKLPEDTGFPLLILSSLCEWGLYVMFFLYIFTFCFEYKNYQLMVTVVPPDDIRN